MWEQTQYVILCSCLAQSIQHMPPCAQLYRLGPCDLFAGLRCVEPAAWCHTGPGPGAQGETGRCAVPPAPLRPRRGCCHRQWPWTGSLFTASGEENVQLWGLSHQQVGLCVCWDTYILSWWFSNKYKWGVHILGPFRLLLSFQFGNPQRTIFWL